MTKPLSLNPEICIVFNSGAAGDFLVALLYQQLHDNNFQLSIDRSGKIENQITANFKKRCQDYYNFKFDASLFDQLNLNSIVCNTHYCHRELLNLFPDCKFYYIDDTEYLDVILDLYIEKRIHPYYDSLETWFLTNPINKFKKNIRLTENQVEKIMKLDWQKNTNSWKKLGIESISFGDILDRQLCENLLKYIINNRVKFNLDRFDYSHDLWTRHNKKIIKSI